MCAQLIKRNHDYRAAASAKLHADRLAEFRSIAFQFHKEGRELVLHHIMKRLSVPRGLEHKLAKEVFATVKAEIKTREAAGMRLKRKKL